MSQTRKLLAENQRKERSMKRIRTDIKNWWQSFTNSPGPASKTVPLRKLLGPNLALITFSSKPRSFCNFLRNRKFFYGTVSYGGSSNQIRLSRWLLQHIVPSICPQQHNRVAYDGQLCRRFTIKLSGLFVRIEILKSHPDSIESFGYHLEALQY